MELLTGWQAPPSPEQPEQQEHQRQHRPTDSFGPGNHVLLAVNVTMFSLVVLAMIHRFVSRRIAGDRIKGDDWTAVAALFFITSVVTCQLLTLRFGPGGTYVGAFNPTAHFKIVVAAKALYSPAMLLVKISLILFYKRLFTTTLQRRLLYALAIAVVLYNLISLVLGLATCVPIERYWNHDAPGYCIDAFPMIAACAAIDIITTVALALFPLPHLLRTRSTQRGCFFAAGIICLSLVVCAFAIFRTLAIQLGNTPADPGPADGGFWPTLELCTGLICACIPTFVWHRRRGRQYGVAPLGSEVGSVSTMSYEMGGRRSARSTWMRNGGRRPLGQRSYVRANPGRFRSEESIGELAKEVEEGRDGLGRGFGGGKAGLGRGIMVTTKIGQRTSAS